MLQTILSKLKLLAVIGLVLASLAALPLLSAQPAFADAKSDLCSGANLGTSCTLPAGQKTVPQTIANVVNILIFVIGAVSVIFIVIGGIKYVISNGDQAQVTSAKNTIMYAIVGLVVAIAAYGIVAFVITQFTK